MFFFDPMYILLVLLPGLLISGAASLMVRSAFNRYSRVAGSRGYTGARAAQILLERAGVYGVDVVPTPECQPRNKWRTLPACEDGHHKLEACGTGLETTPYARNAPQNAPRFA